MAESDPPRHPLVEVPLNQCYDWMLTRCAELENSRQAREDSLISSITQISSAALLIIPSLLMSKDNMMPQFDSNKLFYFGISGFALSLIASMAEQYLSGKAYPKQIEVTQQYYLQQSEKTEDTRSRYNLKMARRVAYLAFMISVICAAAGMILMRQNNG